MDSNSIGRRHSSRRQKSPCGAFLDARLAQSTRAHQELRYPIGTGVSVLSALQKGLQGWIRTATATTTASGRNREELLGLRPAGCACRPRHDAAAGSRDPGSFSARLAQSTRAHQELRYPMDTGVSVLSTLPCCFHFVRLSEQLGKNTVLHNKPGGGQGEDAAIKGGVPGADAVFHRAAGLCAKLCPRRVRHL